MIFVPMSSVYLFKLRVCTVRIGWHIWKGLHLRSYSKSIIRVILYYIPILCLTLRTWQTFELYECTLAISLLLNAAVGWNSFVERELRPPNELSMNRTHYEERLKHLERIIAPMLKPQEVPTVHHWWWWWLVGSGCWTASRSASLHGCLASCTVTSSPYRSSHRWSCSPNAGLWWRRTCVSTASPTTGLTRRSRHENITARSLAAEALRLS